MEEGTKSFVKEVKALPKQIRDEDCFKVYSLLSLALYMLARVKLIMKGTPACCAVIAYKLIVLNCSKLCMLMKPCTMLSMFCNCNLCAVQGLDLSVKNFLTSVPLVADLRSPAMRERHWTQLMTTTKVIYSICSAWCLACPHATLLFFVC